jgi:hypothetical protein
MALDHPMLRFGFRPTIFTAALTETTAKALHVHLPLSAVETGITLAGAHVQYARHTRAFAGTGDRSSQRSKTHCVVNLLHHPMHPKSKTQLLLHTLTTSSLVPCAFNLTSLFTVKTHFYKRNMQKILFTITPSQYNSQKPIK